ncbi:tripartite tricarboxylate transporter substrate binding protein [Halalkalibacter oceani]|uniref:Tripartite tricarboxylate transporter substrate binding protein n=1 Tax=Halalkalibacter oceani TaxID=1653776 RepID=A0A9X2DMF7_9BACI|nr:tripartite tricarboxylate transporter substrate binding protein [Halalkalibacter oceani]MCM3713294.1 tripartite tricarboxylate transporter substrate binding protein [Halalkalibacter oceani]
MRKPKPLLILLCAIGIFFGLVACGQSEQTATEGPADQDEQTDETSKEETASLEYPTRDIVILVGHGAGGGMDTFSRQVAAGLEDRLGVNVNVINHEGAGGVIAKEIGANEPADGYTIVATGALPIQVAMGTNTDNQLNVFTPIARLQSDTFALQIKPGTFESIEDLFEQAKSSTIKIGGTGIGTTDHIVFTMLHAETELAIEFIPFEGAGQMHAALLGGHIDAMLEEVGPVASSIEAGEMEPILFFAEERIDDFPDVPTSVELGYDITTGVERGLMIRNEVPDEIIELLEETVKDIYDSPEYKEFEKNAFLHLREGWLSSEEYHEKLTNDIELFTEILSSIDTEQQ